MQPESGAGSVTRWIHSLQAGSEEAAVELWRRYFRALCYRARQCLGGERPGMVDEEDIALDAFNSICRAAREGRFAELNDRSDLWQLLVMVASRKALDHRRYAGRLRRGGGTIQTTSLDQDSGILELASGGLTPDLLAMFAEENRRLFDALGDDTLRQIALLKLEGYSNQEIAEALNCVPRTVIRKVKLIRKIVSERQ